MKKPNHKPLAISHSQITIGWLYPELMSTYGDRGNIMVLKKRLAAREIMTTILPITLETPISELKKIDFIFGGGAQDREQDIVMRDLKGKKGEVIHELIENGTPALFVCGAPQLMGKSYEPAVGQQIEGLGIFDMETKNPGSTSPRLIGNIIADVSLPDFSGMRRIVGFENHGGRTILGEKALPFATVVTGFGNNGEDQTEGVRMKNAIGCYFHGPLLPKNPAIADWLIQKSLENKYGEKVALSPLDDHLATQARETIAKRLSVNI